MRRTARPYTAHTPVLRFGRAQHTLKIEKKLQSPAPAAVVAIERL